MFKERSSEFFEAEAMLALGHRIPLKNPDGSQVLNEDGSVTLTGSRYDLSGYRMYDSALRATGIAYV